MQLSRRWGRDLQVLDLGWQKAAMEGARVGTGMQSVGTASWYMRWMHACSETALAGVRPNRRKIGVDII